MAGIGPMLPYSLCVAKSQATGLYESAEKTVYESTS